MAKYAEGTSVSVARSRDEIERTLDRYGATGFMYGQQGDTAMIAFQMKKRHIRIQLEYPRLESFLRPKTGGRRTPTQARAFYDREVRRLWRSLLMIIKAKLEAIEAGVTTLEDEFLANVVMPNNQTVSQWLVPQVEASYQTGRMPPLLPGIEKPDIAGYLEGEVAE